MGVRNGEIGVKKGSKTGPNSQGPITNKQEKRKIERKTKRGRWGSNSGLSPCQTCHLPPDQPFHSCLERAE